MVILATLTATVATSIATSAEPIRVAHHNTPTTSALSESQLGQFGPLPGVLPTPATLVAAYVATDTMRGPTSETGPALPATVAAALASLTVLPPVVAPAPTPSPTHLVVVPKTTTAPTKTPLPQHTHTSAPPTHTNPTSATGECSSACEAWAHSSTTNKVTQCESDGDYTLKDSNGHYGKYQFAPGTWTDMGGSGNPADASPSEQDMRAYKLYQDQGWAPWTCARITGVR